MLEPRAARQLLDLLQVVENELALPEFVRFWKLVLERVGETAARGGELQHESVRTSLTTLVDYLSSGGPDKTSEQELQSSILGGVPVLFDEKDLPGKSSDPSTPLGYYRMISGIDQPEEGFKALFPYFLGEFERGFQGSAATFPYVVAHGRGDLDKQGAVVETSDHITSGIRIEAFRDLNRRITRTVDDLLLATPFLVLLTAQDYYQFGARFYCQGELQYHKCALTSGCVIPEDYYSEALYEVAKPGLAVSHDLAPGVFHGAGIVGNEFWRELALQASTESAGRPDRLNPYRPIYFDSALAAMRERGGHLHVLIDVERTGTRLRDRAEYWSARGQGDAYLKDARKLLAYFLADPHTSLHWIRSFDSGWRSSLPDDPLAWVFSDAPLSAPHLTSLLSNRICVYTSRGSLSRVNRGFWVNPAVLEYIEPSPRSSWELIPVYLLGLRPESLEHAPGTPERRYLLDRFIHGPVESLFSASSCTVVGADQNVPQLADRIVDELLHPSIERLARPISHAFLTLNELVDVFDRSYARLRHWIREFNLGSYSSQAYDHRFTQQSLERFVLTELRGRRGFSEVKTKQILDRIQRAFAGKT